MHKHCSECSFNLAEDLLVKEMKFQAFKLVQKFGGGGEGKEFAHQAGKSLIPVTFILEAVRLSEAFPHRSPPSLHLRTWGAAWADVAEGPGWGRQPRNSDGGLEPLCSLFPHRF